MKYLSSFIIATGESFIRAFVVVVGGGGDDDDDDRIRKVTIVPDIRGDVRSKYAPVQFLNI
jgi:hypothetical protein